MVPLVYACHFKQGRLNFRMGSPVSMLKISPQKSHFRPKPASHNQSAHNIQLTWAKRPGVRVRVCVCTGPHILSVDIVALIATHTHTHKHCCSHCTRTKYWWNAEAPFRSGALCDVDASLSPSPRSFFPTPRPFPSSSTSFSPFPSLFLAYTHS